MTRFLKVYRLFYAEEARDAIGALPIKKKRQVKEALERIADNPDIGKRLTHELSGLWSYRSGDYRIIYKIERAQIRIIVLAVGHRRDIYEALSRRFKS